MTLEETIEEYRGIVESKILNVEQAKKKLDKLIELKKLKEKRLSGEKLSMAEIQSAMELLCWNHFAGCCAPWKDCSWHKAVADALGIDYEKLYTAKKKTVEKFIFSKPP